ncbi:unnamed protein product, partial [Mesorhabditis belari]|uniref:Uncharacterized protein n=1 Tax=Mesorhabditis belari TaxID=2138241 RepID=A0AAF3FKH5_9BILA
MNSIFFGILLVTSFFSLTEANCYDNWSRCTPETSFWTGILWKDCPDYCRECQGRESGGCVRVENKECSGGYQCQCSGGNVDKSGNWIVMATCALGL